MEDAYVELKGVSAMKGSINAIISDQRKGYRPPALSESFAWSAENIQRANASTASLDLLVVQSPPTSPQTTPPPLRSISTKRKRICTEVRALNAILRFLFHIMLISIFESLFFFYYVNSLEDNGINNTVGQLLNGAVSACENSTSLSINITNDILGLFINSSLIITQGDTAYIVRKAENDRLYTRAWVYVGGLSGLFTLLTGVALLRRVSIKWKKLVLENLVLVSILAAYEYTFFSTVIFPYTPITGDEITRNALFEFQGRCGLLRQ
jgi:hypothetical protein